MPVSWEVFYRLCYVPWTKHILKELQKVKPSDELAKKIAKDYDRDFNTRRK